MSTNYDSGGLSQAVDNHRGGDYDPSLYETVGTVTPIDVTLDELTSRHLDEYRRLGFLAVDTALPQRLVEDALQGVDDLISGVVPEFRGIQWEAKVKDLLPDSTLDERRGWVRKLFDFSAHDRRLRAIAEYPPLLKVVSSLLRIDQPALFADQALLKPPGIGREKPWHQDLAFFDVRPGAPVLGVWIALDETDTSNGCMHVLPSSHSEGPVHHARVRDLQICDADVDRSRVHAVPLQPGGCLFFDGLLHHGTPANRSGRRRWALQFHYANAADISSSSHEREAYREGRFERFGVDGPETC